jgi:hypothetical protein
MLSTWAGLQWPAPPLTSANSLPQKPKSGPRSSGFGSAPSVGSRNSSSRQRARISRAVGAGQGCGAIMAMAQHGRIVLTGITAANGTNPRKENGGRPCPTSPALLETGSKSRTRTVRRCAGPETREGFDPAWRHFDASTSGLAPAHTPAGPQRILLRSLSSGGAMLQQCCRLRRPTLSTKNKRFLFRMARMARMKSFPSLIRCRRALPVARFRMCSESQDHRNFFAPWRLLGCGRHGPVVVLCPTGSRRAACRPPASRAFAAEPG